MVRRRGSAPAAQAQPRWVMTFVEDDWAGDDVFMKWRAWQEEVVRFVDDEPLSDRDLSLRESVMENHHRVGRSLREEYGVDHTDTHVSIKDVGNTNGLTTELPSRQN